jgi:hypothetical protein
VSLTAAELRAVWSVDERPLDKSLSGASGKVSNTLGKVAAAAAGVFAFDKIKDGFFSVTGAASDLSETVNKSDVIFGQNAAAIDAWAKTAAQNLGLSRQQALASAAGFGDMFSQIGFAGDQAADMSRTVVQMAADFGSFNDLETADVANRMSAAFRGEYDSLQAVIPNINAARVESEALAATGKTVAKELTAQEKAAAVLAIMQKDGARAMGDFARTSESAANSAKSATAEWEDQKTAIGEKLLPAYTALIGFVRGTVIPAVGALAAFIGDDVVPALQAMAQWIDANSTPILVIAGLIAAVMLPHLLALAATSTATAIKQVAAWAMTKASAVGAAAVHSAQVIGMIGKWVLLGAQSLLHAGRMAAAWVIAMGPVGWVIAAVVGLVALIIANWDKVKRFTGAAWDWVSSKVSGAARGAKDAAVSTFAGLVSWVSGLPGRIVGALGNLGSLLLGAGKDLIRGFINGIKNMAGAVAGAAMDVAKGAVNGIKNFLGISSPSKVFAGLGENVGEGFVQGIAGMRPAVAAEMARLADTQALGALTVRPPAGARTAGASTGVGQDSAVTAGDAGRGSLFHADSVTVIEGTPDDVARQLAVELRTRGH